ncbi:hypothetical protein GW17_00061720 [Ensete ventricosum]|nr:hypothetical protein GW17_00061720 [Ensete ventricosum]
MPPSSLPLCRQLPFAIDNRPAIGGVAPAGGRAGRGRQPLAGRPQSVMPAGGRPLRAAAPAGGRPLQGAWSEIAYPYIPDPDGEDEGGQASSSLAVSTRWISAAKLLQYDLTTLAQREGGE